MNGLSTGLFPEQDEKYQQSLQLSLESLSPGSSATLLNKVLKLGSIVRTLSQFVEQQYSDGVGRTWFAYVSSLHEYLTFGPFQILDKLTTKAWCASETQFTVLSFIRFLESSESDHTYQCLHSIQRLHQRVLETIRPDRRYLTTVFTLDRLYESISTSKSHTQKWIWQMFLSCIRPSLVYLQDFFVSGDFDDPNDEFYFQKNQTFYTEHFWDECLNVRIDSHVPKVFASHWKYILVGVRSRLLIAHFDSDFHFNTITSDNLFNIFCKELFVLMSQSRLKTVRGSTSKSELGKMDQSKSSMKDSVECSLSDVTEHDSESAINLNRYFRLPDVSLKLDTEDDRFLKSQSLQVKYSKQPEVKFLHQRSITAKPLHSKHFFGYMDEQSFNDDDERDLYLLPLHLIVQRALNKALQSFVQPICNQIMKLFKQKFQHHVAVMNNYYLMQLQGHLLSLFFDRLFGDLLSNPGKPCGKLPCNFDSSNSIDRLEAQGSAHVIAYFSSIQASFHTNIYFNILSSFYLLYQNIDPITLTILNASIRQFYHDSFQILLRFRFCKWIVENMRFENRSLDRHCRLVRSHGYECFHLLMLVRFRLLSLLNALYSSLMQQIDETVNRLETEANQAQDYEQVRDVFEKFKQEIECNLWMKKNDTKSILMNNLIDSLHEYVFKLRDLWLLLERNFDPSTNEFASAKQFDQKAFCAELQQMHDHLINNSKAYRCFENV